eukprot:1245672-Rhodomonas_salina.1
MYFRFTRTPADPHTHRQRRCDHAQAASGDHDGRDDDDDADWWPGACRMWMGGLERMEEEEEEERRGQQQRSWEWGVVGD